MDHPPMTALRFLSYFILFPCAVKSVKIEQSLPEVVKQGVRVAIHCNHDDSSYPIMLWYQHRPDRRDMTLIGFGYGTGEPTYEGTFQRSFQLTRESNLKGALVLNNTAPSDSAVYYCAARGTGNYNPAYFGSGTKLTVLDRKITPPTVTLLPPSEAEKKDRKDQKKKKTFVCVATGFYPDHVSVLWKVGGEERTTGVGTDTQALWSNTSRSYSLTSRLRVPAQEWFTPLLEFTCTVRFYNGDEYLDFTDVIYGIQGQYEGMTAESYMKSTQTAKLAYGVFIAKSSFYALFIMVYVWRLQGSSGKQYN